MSCLPYFTCRTFLIFILFLSLFIYLGGFVLLFMGGDFNIYTFIVSVVFVTWFFKLLFACLFAY